jgi:two-component system, NtrC family, sensor kinase
VPKVSGKKVVIREKVADSSGKSWARFQIRRLPHARPLNLSLRTKGLLTLAAVIFYLAFIAWFLAYQRQGLVEIVREIEINQANQNALAAIAAAVTHSLFETDLLLDSSDYGRKHPLTYADIAQHFDDSAAALHEAAGIDPALMQEAANFQQGAQVMRGAPTQIELGQMRQGQKRAVEKLEELSAGLQKRSQEFAQQYRERQQFISVFAISANVVGAVISMAVILIFFTRLAKDIKRLQDRAAAIVAGYAGDPLPNTRRDEIGGLIDAVNRMQVDLRRWERQQEINRQQRFHHDKMATIGSLAAAIGHEVNNPIAAISGIAQFIIDETKEDARPSCKTVNEFAGSILKQTERITSIMRQMATLTAPHSPKPELLDVNALIRSTWSFLSYDKRLRGVQLEQDLDHDLPAVEGVADHITQILMNVIINAADAMDHITDPTRRRIVIATRVVGDEISISITDNGRGMSPEVLAKAFDDSFTTKPAGKGSGLGLFICKSLIEQAGGGITLASLPDQGTTATVYVPLRRSTTSAPAPAEPATV